MSTDPLSAEPPSVPDGLLSITYVIYGLHALSALGGILSSAFVVTAFVGGWPSLIAVIINYVKRRTTRGTYLESHFRWQIRTFWFALLWVVFVLLFVFFFVCFFFVFLVVS